MSYSGQQYGQLLAWLSRPQNSLYSAVLAGGLALLLHASPWQVIGVFTSVQTMYALAAFYNNMHDITTDRLNGRSDNPLINFTVSKRFIYSCFALLALWLAAWQFALQQPVSLLLTLLYVILCIAYSRPGVALQARDWLAPITLCCCYAVLPFLLGVSQTTQPLPLHMYVFLLLLQCLVALPIILAKDYKDIKGDRATKKHTPMVQHGIKTVRWVATIACFASVGLFLSLAVAWHGHRVLALGLALHYLLFCWLLHWQRGKLPMPYHKLALLVLIGMPMLLIWPFIT